MIQAIQDSILPCPSCSMSSALVYPPASLLPQSSRTSLGGVSPGPQQQTEYIKSWQSLVNSGRFESGFASGLPTPPETKAMTGVRRNQHNLNDAVSQSYFLSKFSNSGVDTASSAEAKPRQNNVQSYNHNRSSTRGQLQVWPTSQEKETSHIPKDGSMSDSTIAAYLQIPLSINNSKGSLAEFAAEVSRHLPRLQSWLIFSRLHVFSGSRRRQPCTVQKMVLS